jgi:hypothetical protein
MSPDFLLDLGLMYDCLFEVSNLSLSLQERSISLIEADKMIKSTIKRINSFIANPGTKLMEAMEAAKNNKFNDYDLTENLKHVKIDKKKFIEALAESLEKRCFTNLSNKNQTKEHEKKNAKDYAELIESLKILNKSNWNQEDEYDYGRNEIRFLCNKFGIDIRSTLNDFSFFLSNNVTRHSLQKLLNAIELIPISNAECERGFSQMNLICNDLRCRLNVTTLSNLLFLKINGPNLNDLNVKKYVRSWILKHKSADMNHNTKTKKEEEKSLIHSLFI